MAPSLPITTALTLANFRCFGRPACSFRLRARFCWGRGGTDFSIGNWLSQYASDSPPIAATVPVPQPIKALGRQGQGAPKHESLEKPVGWAAFLICDSKIGSLGLKCLPVRSPIQHQAEALTPHIQRFNDCINDFLRYTGRMESNSEFFGQRS